MGTAADVLAVANLTLSVAEYILDHEFTDGPGNWPHWYMYVVFLSRKHHLNRGISSNTPFCVSFIRKYPPFTPLSGHFFLVKGVSLVGGVCVCV